MVDYTKDIGSGTHSANLSSTELEEMEEAAAFNGDVSMDEEEESKSGDDESPPPPLPRGSSPTQEYERQVAIDATENNQPFPPNRKRCTKKGEILVSSRCTQIKPNGEQCGARTRNGRFCWNHLKKEGLRIRQSNIVRAGKGLFAEKDYARGEEIAKYTGDESNDPEVDHGGSNYVVGLSREVSIDAARTNTAPGRMINDTRGSR